MVAAVKAAAKDGDSLGGVAEVLAYGVPVGLGSHVHWDRRLDGLLAQALMSIQAVKAVEIGEGWDVAGRRGSVAHDAIRLRRRRGRPASAATPTRAGGIEGGMSTGGLVVGPGGHEAAGHPQPPGARDRRRRHQGADRLLQGAHRRHRGAGHGRGGRDHDAPWCWPPRRCASSAATRWPRWSATATASWRRWARRPSAARRHGPMTKRPAGRDDGGGQDHRRPAGGRAARLALRSTPTPRWRRPPGARCPSCSPSAARPPSGRPRPRCWPRRWPRTGRWWCRWPAARCSTRPTGR